MARTGGPFSRLAVGASVDEPQVLGRGLAILSALQFVFDLLLLYGWYPEESDPADPKEAKSLLEDLS